MMSACGWPDPSTGMRLPRGQCSQDWISRVSWFSSRMARSRYFSRISSSVAGTVPLAFDGAESLGYMAVGAGAGHDPVLGGEARRLLVEGRERHTRVEDLDRVDVLHDLQQVLVVGHRVHPVE